MGESVSHLFRNKDVQGRDRALFLTISLVCSEDGKSLDILTGADMRRDHATHIRRVFYEYRKHNGNPTRVSWVANTIFAKHTSTRLRETHPWLWYDLRTCEGEA